MNKLVSVVIPVYNAEEYLKDCIDSIVNQTYNNMEIILVDDGSSDGSSKICDDYATLDSRVKVIHRAKDSDGPGEARNVGAASAKGEYLLFVDNDDWVSKTLVEKTVGVAEKNDADVVLFHYARIENGIAVDTPSTSVKLPDNTVISAETNPEVIISSWSPVDKLFRLSFWKKNGFEFVIDKYYEDLGTIPKPLTFAERIVQIPDILYYYRIQPKSIMHDHDFEKKYADRKYIIDGLLDYYEKKGIAEKFKTELEYLVIKNMYFYPAREIVYFDPKSKYLNMFRDYAYSKFPKLNKNKYLKQMPANDKLFWFFIKHGMYEMPVFLSKLKTFVKKLLRR